MNAYEFTRFESDFTSKVKAQAYDARIVAMMAAQSKIPITLKPVTYSSTLQ